MSFANCEITIDPECLTHIERYLSKQNFSKLMLLTDEKLLETWGIKIIQQIESCGMPCHLFSIPGGESAKTIHTIIMCWQKLVDSQADKDTLLLLLGGGVITDIGGFAAATYMRGIRFINIPTTLLGMVDAAIGGKNGVNLPEGKNVIGTIYHPEQILIYPPFLETLPERELRSGLAEVIKAAVIWDESFFIYLKEHMPKLLALDPDVLPTVLSNACGIKAHVIAEDAKYKSFRDILNYGHTFGHAIEALTNYTACTHGEAIAIGMSCAAYLGLKLGLCSTSFIEQQDRLLSSAGLSTALPNISLTALLKQMKGDKKTVSGQMTFIIPKGIGQVVKVEGVLESDVISALEMKLAKQ